MCEFKFSGTPLEYDLASLNSEFFRATFRYKVSDGTGTSPFDKVIDATGYGFKCSGGKLQVGRASFEDDAGNSCHAEDVLMKLYKPYSDLNFNRLGGGIGIGDVRSGYKYVNVFHLEVCPIIVTWPVSSKEELVILYPKGLKDGEGYHQYTIPVS